MKLFRILSVASLTLMASATAFAGGSLTVGESGPLDGGMSLGCGGTVSVRTQDDGKDLIVSFRGVRNCSLVSVVGVNGRGVNGFVPVRLQDSGFARALDFKLPEEIFAQHGTLDGYNKVILRVRSATGIHQEEIAIRVMNSYRGAGHRSLKFRTDRHDY